MKHVQPQLPAWISGELDEHQAAAVEKHLAECAECAAEAKTQRAIWQELGGAEITPPTSSVWPSVQARTFGQKEQPGWFFGSPGMARSSLAAGAVVAGLMMGMLVPGGTTQVGGEAEALTMENTVVETAWLSGSTWGGEFTDLASDWLQVGLETGLEEDLAEEEGS